MVRCVGYLTSSLVYTEERYSSRGRPSCDVADIVDQAFQTRIALMIIALMVVHNDTDMLRESFEMLYIALDEFRRPVVVLHQRYNLALDETPGASKAEENREYKVYDRKYEEV